MSWAYKQSTSTAFGSSSSARTLAYSSNVTQGDLLLVAVSHHAGASGSTVSITDSQGNSYSQAGSYASSGNGLNRVSLWWAIAGSTGANTVTVTPSTTVSMAIGVHEYSTSLSSLAVDGSNTGTGTSITPNPGLVPVSGSDDLGICIAGQAGGTSSATAGSPYTLRVNVTGSTSVGLYTEDVLDVSTGQTPTFTLSVSESWYCLGVTFKGSAGTPSAGPLPNLVTPPQIHPSFWE